MLEVEMQYRECHIRLRMTRRKWHGKKIMRCQQN